MRIFAASGNPTGIAAGDLNGDGFTDLVTTGSQHNSMDVLVNDGMWDATVPGSGAVVIGRASAKGPGASDMRSTPAQSNETIATWPHINSTAAMAVTGTMGLAEFSTVHTVFGRVAPARFDLDALDSLWAN
jgi:hypothetical protein